MRAGNFLLAPQVRAVALEGAARGRRARAGRLCPPPPLPHFRRPPLPRSPLPGPSVPGETRRRGPTPAGAARSHAPVSTSPGRTD